MEILETILSQVETADFVAIGFLVFLEGILSLDNALVLAMMVRHLNKDQQKKALTYGIIGAFAFRFVALALVTFLLKWTWVKFVGGGYLLFLSIRHFIHHARSEDGAPKPSQAGFWKTVFLIELTDIAFAVDSILAAVAVSKKFWVIFTGGVIGIAMMRFAATLFVRLLDRFPNFEHTAYGLVCIIGVKLVVDGFKFEGVDFHSGSSPAFWIFWLSMLVTIAFGFVGQKKKAAASN